MLSGGLQQSLKSQKRTLRKAIGSALANLAPNTIEEQSQAITRRALALPKFQTCHSVSCYLSMPSGEVDTSNLVEAILQSGKDLFVPKIKSKEGLMDFLQVYSQEDLTSLPSGIWGIKEPQEEWNGKSRDAALDPATEPLDVILLPGVAFDRSLSRLGHGKGYYDRFISAYIASNRRKPYLVGLSLREQVLDEEQVPTGEHDWKLDLLVTPDEIIESTSGAGWAPPHKGTLE